jgi:hypothetical protein
MNKIYLNIIGTICSFVLAYNAVYNTSGKTAFAIIFMCGILVGFFVTSIKLYIKNDKLNSYKRELEKESISSSESSSKVKVLESKIQVLEKALENALNK